MVQHSHSDFELLPVRSIQLLEEAVEVRLLTSLLLWRNKNSSKRLSPSQAWPGYLLLFSKDLWSSGEYDLSLF